MCNLRIWNIHYYYITLLFSRRDSSINLDCISTNLDCVSTISTKILTRHKSRPRKKKVDLDVMDNLDRFQKLVLTRWTISISIGLERRDPQAYWNSLDQNCVFSVDRKFHNQLTKFFETFQLIKNSINCQNLQVIFCHLIESFISTKFHY